MLQLPACRLTSMGMRILQPTSSPTNNVQSPQSTSPCALKRTHCVLPPHAVPHQVVH